MSDEASFPRMAHINWPTEFDPHVRLLGERLVLSESLATAIAEAMARHVVNEMIKEQKANS